MGRGGFVCMSSTMRVALTRKREGYEKWGRRLWHWLPFVNRAWPENKKGSCVNSKKKKKEKLTECSTWVGWQKRVLSEVALASLLLLRTLRIARHNWEMCTASAIFGRSFTEEKSKTNEYERMKKNSNQKREKSVVSLLRALCRGDYNNDATLVPSPTGRCNYH